MDAGFAVQVPKANGAVVTLEKQKKSNTNHAKQIPTHKNTKKKHLGIGTLFFIYSFVWPII